MANKTYTAVAILGAIKVEADLLDFMVSAIKISYGLLNSPKLGTPNGSNALADDYYFT